MNGALCHAWGLQTARGGSGDGDSSGLQADPRHQFSDETMTPLHCNCRCACPQVGCASTYTNISTYTAAVKSEINWHDVNDLSDSSLERNLESRLSREPLLTLCDSKLCIGHGALTRSTQKRHQSPRKRDELERKPLELRMQKHRPRLAAISCGVSSCSLLFASSLMFVPISGASDA